jgi:NADH-quinone oxidoreductase subunit C
MRRPVKRKPIEMPLAPWEGSVPTALRERFGGAIVKTQLLGGQKLAIIDPGAVASILELLKNEHGFDYLVDVTAVHWPKKEKQFEITWILYSFASNDRVRLKAAVAEGEKAPSATSLYNSANWLEREAYDMFGIEFEDHPDLRRILMPDEWEGFPLRKEYGIVQQDTDWVRENLKIESAQ